MSTRLVSRGLRKRLGSTLALAGIDLQVEAKEIVALLGPNGAGKTTLLHVLAGLIRPDEGSLTPDPDAVAARAHIGFAPQPTAVYEDLTVEENLAFFARIHGVRDLDDAVTRGLSFARLESRAKARAGTLSGGMRRRLHVATAIVHRPTLLLLDEPTVGIDGASCEHLLEAIGALRDAGTAVVWSTHDRAPIDRLGARAVLLERGRIVS